MENLNTNTEAEMETTPSSTYRVEVIVKSFYGIDIRKFNFDYSNYYKSASFSNFKSIVHEKHGINDKTSILISYIDNEGEKISIGDNE